MTKEHVVLAYSGGLDTSFCVKYLKEEKGLDVHAVLVQTGGYSPEQLEVVRQKAIQLGAIHFEVIDATKDYYDQCLKYLIFGNVLRNQTYPLSVSAERMFQALAIVRYANASGAKYVAHGSTGAGNDQVRFDLAFEVLGNNLEIITPIRDLKLSRQEEIAYLEKHGVTWSWEKAKYSINQGIWGTSVGGAETLTSDQGLPEEAWPKPVEAEAPLEIVIGFSEGEPSSLNGEKFDHPVQLIEALETLATPFGVGRDMHVGDTIIGIKGRVGFAAAAALVLIRSHHLLEKHTLGKWQQYWKEQMSNWYGMFLHEAQFLDPVMRNIETFLSDTQKYVTGDVRVLLHPYRFECLGVRTPYDLMQTKFGQYGEMNNAWSGEDVKGFTTILGNASKLYFSLHEEEKNKDMIRVGIIGAAGYTGGELIRLLLGHQEATLVWAVSESQAGKPISSTHTDLIGDLHLNFVQEPDADADVAFLCMGHGRSKEYLDQHTFSSETRIIDLSHDFRLGRQGKHGFVYGLPEAYGDQIKKAQKIANPGCFATAIQLGLLPMAHENHLPQEIPIQAITGSTGAGQSLSETTHFTWRDNNISIYKPFRHQHEAEVLETLSWVGNEKGTKLRFIPVRGNFTRGIFATMYVPYEGSTKEAKQLYEDYYRDHPFVHTANVNIDLKQVVNTNKCLIGLEVIDDHLLIISMIDNLIKGASGQAIQNMNLQFGIPETTGLLLKSTAF